MINFLKKYIVIMLAIFLACIFSYDYLFKQEYKINYKEKGQYAIGTVESIKGFGKGSGYNYIYTFNVNGKKYESVCGIGNLPYNIAQKKINNQFLVLYLNNNIHNNRLYINLPINNIKESELKQKIDNNSQSKSILDSIPASGFFWQNYF
ncbi:hypothetical protein [uncultured Elizabethkingia sp.]|uniref:hypothetical protein n=1 Tax=uncultured Elizabethkingia sp. TaxID=432638 RepID=UPI00259A0D08|nr:hypothetical protein [uncultured Elizabethkingia sp.]